jgi:uncharacterized LabA/DUF88 family protein
MQLALAVDGHSLFHAQQNLNWFFDPRRLLELAAARPRLEISRAFWYLGLKGPADQRPFRDALTSLGHTVRAEPLRERAGETDQRQSARANLDVEIAIDLMAVAHRSDEPWMLSGSHNLDRWLEVLRARGLMIVLAHTDGMPRRR